MKKYYTEKEIKEQLNSMTIVIDTREQINYNITEFLDNKKLNKISRKLDVGDYSLMVGEITYEDSVSIERKASLDELAGNIGIDRQRFENEFLRAKAKGIKVFLLIENASWQDIEMHNYKSNLNPKSFLATLMSWQAKYNLSIIFCKASESGKIIYGTLYYWLKNCLE